MFDTCDLSMEAEGAELVRREEALMQLLPWLSTKERESLDATDPRFPGVFAEQHRLQAYADRLCRARTREVPCTLNLGYARAAARLDLVSGQVLLIDNGRYVKAETTAVVHIEFPDVPLASLSFVELIQGRAKALCGREVAYVVDALEKAGLLPPVRALHQRR